MRYEDQEGYIQKHVAIALGVTRQAVKKRIDRGTIPSFLDAKGRRVVPREWFDEYIKALKESVAANHGELYER